jgi:hypothetical protein
MLDVVLMLKICDYFSTCLVLLSYARRYLKFYSLYDLNFQLALDIYTNVFDAVMSATSLGKCLR